MPRKVGAADVGKIGGAWFVECSDWPWVSRDMVTGTRRARVGSDSVCGTRLYICKYMPFDFRTGGLKIADTGNRPGRIHHAVMPFLSTRQTQPNYIQCPENSERVAKIRKSQASRKRRLGDSHLCAARHKLRPGHGVLAGGHRALPPSLRELRLVLRKHQVISGAGSDYSASDGACGCLACGCCHGIEGCGDASWSRQGRINKTVPLTVRPSGHTGRPTSQGRHWWLARSLVARLPTGFLACRCAIKYWGRGVAKKAR